MPQGVDQVEPGGTAGWGIAKQDTHGGGEQKGDGVDLQIEIERHEDDLREAGTKPEGEEDAKQPADAVANQWPVFPPDQRAGDFNSAFAVRIDCQR